MPIPPIYLRAAQSEEKDRVVREVIDGQQRVSAVLDYMDGKFRLLKSPQSPWAFKYFSELSPADQNKIREYRFPVESFSGISDSEVLEIFARLNTYSVQLNSQELRNGKYFGDFKHSVYMTALQHLEFWRRNKVFTERAVARMLEAEFVSDVFVAFLDGMQDRKRSLDSFYSRYDERFPEQKKVEKGFREVVDVLTESMGDELASSNFRRPPLLYSLFCVVYHRLHGLPKVALATPRKALTRNDRLRLRESVQLLSAALDDARAKEPVLNKYDEFVQACSKHTDNIGPRATRFKTLYKSVFT